jgi:hypothetical protein
MYGKNSCALDISSNVGRDQQRVEGVVFLLAGLSEWFDQRLPPG